MEALYHIRWDYSQEMGGAGFSVLLYPGWKKALAAYEVSPGLALGQKSADRLIETLGRRWLDDHGYDQKSRHSSGRYLYEPASALRISWGEWGPEHITVPGNACGLDIDSNSPGSPRGGTALTPHNVDNLTQASLLLTIFLFFADTLRLNEECREHREAAAVAGRQAH